MPNRSRAILHQHEDSSSEGIDDISEDIIDFPKRPEKHPPSAVPWTEKYTPSRSRDVCINPKKLKQVREILLQMVNSKTKSRILILSGPAGSSKSTVIKCLATELHMSPDRGSVIRPLSVIEYFDSSVEDVNQPGHFRDFMDGCRYRSGQNSSVILIEELPNVFHDETLQSFRKCLQDWIYCSDNLPPVVICLTEVGLANATDNRSFYTIDNYLTVETLLGRDILNSGLAAGLIERVKFLPVAKTFMKKTLDGILVSEKVRLPRTGPSAELMQSLYDSGDVRSSIANLEFWVSRGFTVNTFSREGQISLFYALGKVIHSSSKTSAETPVGMEVISDVVDRYNNPGLLQFGLLENYHIYNGSKFGVDVAAKIVDSLSITDSLDSLGFGEYALEATRYEFSQVPVTTRTLPMRFPRHFKCLKEQNKVRREVTSYGTYIAENSVSFDDINLMDGFFVPVIKNSFKYKLKHGRKQSLYSRVGGRFNKIFADEELPVMEDEDENSGGRDQFSADIAEKINHQATDDDSAASEDIEDSEAADSDDTLEDTLNEDILNMANHFKRAPDSKIESQPQPKKLDLDLDEEFSDDPELDMLVSQGKL